MINAPAAAAPTPADRWVARWLFAVAALVIVMIVVGGLTRLTDSGLSIPEWKPVTGAVPPLSDSAWATEFDKYKEIPEYQLQNRGMTLGEFKAIYWWEWGHRFLGRVIGAAFLIPLIVFWARGWIRRGMRGRLALLFVLGGLQGAVGWWMVSSGLTERVDVSQYRLAVHLGLAFVLLGALWWSALDARAGAPKLLSWRRAGVLAATFAGLVFVQIIAGAFVAGLDAGRVYTTWPLMQGVFVPEAYGALDPWWRNLFDNRAAVQFNHRIGGYLVATTGAGIGVFSAMRLTGPARVAALVVGAMSVGQAGLGIATLLSGAALALSVAHQLSAAVLLIAALTFTRALGLSSARDFDQAPR